jgi:hypothetical protein
VGGGVIKIIGKIIGAGLVGLLVIGMVGWGALAIYYSDLSTDVLRLSLAVCLAAGTFGAFAFLPNRRRTLAGFVVVFVALVAWWITIEPSNARDWQPEVAVLPYADINGDLITVHNIRNFDYRTETDFTPAYYDKTFDLRKLESVDLLAVYWMGPKIAHTFLSFGFEGDDYLAVSIETRKEVGEGYSTIKGFFKQYEIYYVVADERDVIRLRTNYRNNPPEDVYLYRLHGPIENGRRLFMEYVHRINALKEQPEFYSTLTTNCTTTIWLNTRVNPGRLPFSWKLLLSGYVPQYLYEAGRLDTRIPFAELQRQSHINARARATDKAEEFSRYIRSGLEGGRGAKDP